MARRPHDSGAGTISPAARTAITPDDLTRLDTHLASLCATSLYTFVRSAWPLVEPGTHFEDNWHVHVICDALERISHGERARLVINIPPRHMKSLLVSVFWPCWEWITQPHRRWLFASYSGDLSTKHSIDRRTIIESEWYQRHWGDTVRLLKDSNLKTQFTNTARGHMVATSVGGTITGKGGTRLVCDDPINPEQAASDLEREKASRWFRRTFVNRIDSDSNSAIVLVMQRLHEDDPAGVAINELGYDLLKIEAIAEPPPDHDSITYHTKARTYVRKRGNVLWPSRYNAEFLSEQRVALGDNGFAGQYQQIPHAKGGTLFQVDKIVRVSYEDYARLAATVGIVAACRGWDAAGTPGGGDYTAGALLLLLRDHRVLIAHMHREQWASADVDALIRSTAIADGRNVLIREEQEPGSAGLAVVQQRGRQLIGYQYHGERSTGEKIVRWQPLSVHVNNGSVLMLDGPWNAALMAEMESAPRGRKDDQLDAMSLAYNTLVGHVQTGPVMVPVGMRG